MPAEVKAPPALNKLAYFKLLLDEADGRGIVGKVSSNPRNERVLKRDLAKMTNEELVKHIEAVLK